MSKLLFLQEPGKRNLKDERLKRTIFSLFFIVSLFSFPLIAQEILSIQNYISGQDGDPYWVEKALFSSDDRYLIIGATKGKWVSGSILYCIDKASYTLKTFTDDFHLLKDIGISNDSSYILSAGARGRDPMFAGEINIWSLTGSVKKIIDSESEAGATFITSIAISPDSRSFISGGNVKTAKLITRDGFIIRTFHSYSRYDDTLFSEYTVEISADKKYVLLHTKYHTTVWKYDGPLHYTLPINHREKMFPSFAPKGDFIVYFISDDNPVKETYIEFQNHVTGEIKKRFVILQSGELPLSPPAFSSEGTRFGIVTTKGIKIYNTIDGTLLKAIHISLSGSPAISRPAFSHNGHYFLFCLPDKEKVEIIHIPTDERLYVSPSHNGELLIYNDMNQYDCPGKTEPIFGGETGKTHFSPGLLDQFFKKDTQ